MSKSVIDIYNTLDKFHRENYALLAALCSKHKQGWKCSQEGMFVAGIGDDIYYKVPYSYWPYFECEILHELPELMDNADMAQSLLTLDQKLYSKQVGLRIAQLRKEKGISSKEFSDLLKISPNTLARLENGSLRISQTRLHAMIQQLGCNKLDVLPYDGSFTNLAYRMGAEPDRIDSDWIYYEIKMFGVGEWIVNGKVGTIEIWSPTTNKTYQITWDAKADKYRYQSPKTKQVLHNIMSDHEGTVSLTHRKRKGYYARRKKLQKVLKQ